MRPDRPFHDELIKPGRLHGADHGDPAPDRAGSERRGAGCARRRLARGVKVGEVGSSRLDALPSGDVFGKTMAFNVLPKIDAFAEDGSTGEEVRTDQESRKMLGIADLDMAATCVRVPVPVGHSVSLLARFSCAIAPEEARGLLEEAPGVELRDDPANGVYPSPLEAAGRDEALVGRIRQAPGHDNSLLLFACGDNLRKGAALNGIQIEHRLFPTT